MLVGDDEDQTLRLYDRLDSGAPLRSWDITAVNLGLTDFKDGVAREVDIESSTSITQEDGSHRIFWLGSLANRSDGSLAPNRNRLFATDLTGSSLSTYAVNYVGRYDFLRDDLISWDHNNLHGKGVDYYGFTASAAAGKVPKLIDGFNIEGLAMAPDGQTAYIGFRAPFVPIPARNKALIVPLLNIQSLVTGNPTPGPNAAQFGSPIELDLGTRGIRDIAGNGYGMLVVGGAFDDTANFRLFSWSGFDGDPTVALAADLTGMKPEAIVELPILPLTQSSEIQLLSDDGT